MLKEILKYIIISLVMLTAPGALSAGRMLEVRLADGSKALYQLTDDLTVGFAGRDMTVSSPDGAVDYVLADIAGYAYTEGSNDIYDTTTLGSCISLGAHEITLSRPCTAPASITTLSGRLVRHLPKGATKLRLDGLQPGFYIVTIDALTLKIRLTE